jgi:hypothetical protein
MYNLMVRYQHSFEYICRFIHTVCTDNVFRTAKKKIIDITIIYYQRLMAFVPGVRVVETREFVQRQNKKPPKAQPRRITTAPYNLVTATSKTKPTVLGHRTPATPTHAVDTLLPTRTEKTVQQLTVDINDLKQKLYDVNIQMRSFRDRLDSMDTKVADNVSPSSVFARSVDHSLLFDTPDSESPSDTDAHIRPNEQVCLQYPLPLDDKEDAWIRVYRLFSSGELQTFWTKYKTDGIVLFDRLSLTGSVS